MTNAPEIQCRPFNREDIPRLGETYQLCFGVKLGPDYFDWKYFQNPSGQAIGFVAESGNTIAAFYGVIPETYLIDGKPKRIYQSMDTMTHPQFQRRGLFGKLAEQTYAQVAKQEGSLNLIGVAGPTSYPGFVGKLKWKGIKEFRFMFANRLMFSARSLINGGKSLEFALIRESSPQLERFLAQRKISPAPIQIRLSPEFLNWRVFKNPTKPFKVLTISDSGKMVGICIFTPPDKGRCFIHYLGFQSDELYATYAKSVLARIFSDQAPSSIFTWEPLNPALRAALGKNGFISNPFKRGPFSYRTPLIVRAEPENSDGRSWYDIRNFDLQPLMQD